MKRPINVILFSYILATAFGGKPDGLPPGQGRGLIDSSSKEFPRIENQYIIMLEESVDLEGAKSEMGRLNSFVHKSDMILTNNGVDVFKGFVVKDLNRGRANTIASDARVKAVIQDMEVKTTSTPLPGLDRIDQRFPPLDNFDFIPEGFGHDAHIYIIDSGIRVTHDDFNGRAFNFLDVVNPIISPHLFVDYSGHGTACASIAAGRRYGVAKCATVHAVKMIDPFSPFSLADLFTALLLTAGNAQAPAVISLSLFTGYNEVLNTIVDYITNTYEIPVIVTVGNPISGLNPCLHYSPTSAAEAYVVAGTDAVSDTPLPGHASCVDMFAPGVLIESATHLNDFGSKFNTGNSFAVPFVAGVAAIILDLEPYLTADEVKEKISETATRNIISGVFTSENHLLYTSPYNETLKRCV
ncbi:aqualysin-1-like [Antedon mediterranea]|uniref:aqualysin-1-like n=1 Tax=Antedon mediterranea TaxID=105859 RepID=UPI003AF6536C